MENPEDDSQIVKPTGKHLGLVVWQWLKIAIIAASNVLILALFASYFDHQTISLLTIIGIIADAMSIVLGLLGIWFYFLSEHLNRTTAVNLEKTTATVSDLREQMWQMIQKTFTTFVSRDSKEQADETRQAIEELNKQVNQQDGVVPTQIIQAINALNQRLDSIERKQDLSIITPTRSSRVVSRNERTEEKRPDTTSKGLYILNKYKDNFPMTYEDFHNIIRKEISPTSVSSLVDSLIYAKMFDIEGYDVYKDTRPQRDDMVKISSVSKSFLENSSSRNVDFNYLLNRGDDK